MPTYDESQHTMMMTRMNWKRRNSSQNISSAIIMTVVLEDRKTMDSYQKLCLEKVCEMIRNHTLQNNPQCC